MFVAVENKMSKSFGISAVGGALGGGAVRSAPRGGSTETCADYDKFSRAMHQFVGQPVVPVGVAPPPPAPPRNRPAYGQGMSAGPAISTQEALHIMRTMF